MDDLFRFVLLRPADQPAQDEVKVLQPQDLDTAQPRPEARRRAAALLAGDRVVRRTDDLAYADIALAVRTALARGPLPTADVEQLVQDSTGGSLADVLADERFGDEESRLATTLVATKLVSDSARTDARGLAAVAQGYDALRRAGGDVELVALRPLAMPAFGVQADGRQNYPSRVVPSKESPVQHQEKPHEPTPAEQQITRIDAAVHALSDVRAADFRVPDEREQVARGTTDDAAHERDGRETDEGGSRALQVSAAWKLTDERLEQLPGEVHATLKDLQLDPNRTALPVVLQGLKESREALLAEVSSTLSASSTVVQVGGSFFGTAQSSDLVGKPGTPMPTGHGKVVPVGVGDLLMVRQHVLRYEGGEVAHVENVLRSENLERETRRLDRTETTVLSEKETTTEDERDTQSTDRFSLKRETSSTLSEESEFKAGVAVTAKYGPFVEVKANADLATKSSSEESTKQASEFSKDVVARSVSKVVERVLERRSTTTVSEFEEKYRHGFDNTAGATNISGVYQWVDKVLQAQVYNYGKRMLFDVTVPEPGTSFIAAQSTSSLEGRDLVKPPPFTLSADQITEGNYRWWGHVYDVTGLEAPPPPYKTLSKAFAAVVPDDRHDSSASAELTIDEGYQAQYALFQCGYWFYGGAVWQLMIGSNWVDGMGSQGYFDMSGEVGTVALSYYAHQVGELAATIEIFCRRTDRAMQAWQLKTHAAITQGYLAKQQAYESALAEAAAAAGVVITGRNPLWNQRITTTELRKQCLTLLTAQHFDAFGALELSPQGYPQPNLARAEVQMPYVRFFEQAFEWEHLVYFFYPYFWGWKPAWSKRMLLDDVDPVFADFLRAGAARVVFPVRPGFEAAVAHYLETGEIWDGGPAPDVNDPLYVPIIKEIQEATGAPGDEVAQGEPWLVRLPTTLAKLRADDELPAWKKVGDDWQPVS